jgi:hypothetical protein
VLATSDDVAPDASIFPREPDGQTGGRRLEELAFEVMSTQRLNRIRCSNERSSPSASRAKQLLIAVAELTSTRVVFYELTWPRTRD